jgi:hypothetical protein
LHCFFSKKQTIVFLIPFFFLIPNSNSLFLQKNIYFYMKLSEMSTTALQIPEKLPNNTRVWVYLSNRPFTEKEQVVLNSQLAAFAQHWTAHNLQLQAFSTVFDNQFITLMVDESKAGASGCSIDKSVHFLQSIESQYDVKLFDRWLFAYQHREEMLTADRNEFTRLYRTGILNDETLVFDTMVNVLGDFKTNRWKPLGKSWHKRLI